MATQNLLSSASSFSVDESPEYCTMRECFDALVDLLEPAVSSLGDMLFARGLIPQKIISSETHPDKACRKVVNYVTNRVKHDKRAYHKFVNILREQGQWTESIVEKLTSCYESQTATPESTTVDLIESGQGQSKLRIEFTVPQDVPQEVFTALESVQVSVLVEDQNRSKRTVMETQLRVGEESALLKQGSQGTQVPWDDEPGKWHGAAGRRDVLFLVSSASSTDNSDIVPRRFRGSLTEEERGKLEEQGVHRDMCHSDLSIMTARRRLSKRYTILEVVSAERTTCVEIKRRIKDIMNTTDKDGAVLNYIGPGKKGTGDWCFSDGFITFREIMDLYTQHFRGRVLTIVSDCSYSGSWVREAMAFMDKQGVGPCGHTAKEKGMLVKVFASCLANEIPAELAFSTHCVQNCTSTGNITYPGLKYYSNKIHDSQHSCELDFTGVRCKNKIDQPCTMAPGSTWERWHTASRVRLVSGTDRGRAAWYYVVLEDNEDTRKAYNEKLGGSLDVADYGEVVKSGWGKDPPDSVKKEIKERYHINYDYVSN